MFKKMEISFLHKKGWNGEGVCDDYWQAFQEQNCHSNFFLGKFIKRTRHTDWHFRNLSFTFLAESLFLLGHFLPLCPRLPFLLISCLKVDFASYGSSSYRPFLISCFKVHNSSLLLLLLHPRQLPKQGRSYHWWYIHNTYTSQDIHIWTGIFLHCAHCAMCILAHIFTAWGFWSRPVSYFIIYPTTTSTPFHYF